MKGERPFYLKIVFKTNIACEKAIRRLEGATFKNKVGSMKTETTLFPIFYL